MYYTYATNLKIWRKRYKVAPKPFDPTKKNAIRKCAKCHKTKKKMHRHHKGYDYLFACLRPDLFAERYIQFLEEDIDDLCSTCHKKFETDIRNIVVDEMQPYPKRPSEAWCNKWRGEILKLYQEWLNGDFD